MTNGDHDEVKRLGRWLSERRWYGEKTRTLTGSEVTFHADVNVGSATVRFEIRRLSFASGHPADYLLITDPADPEADGVESERVRRWLADSFIEGRGIVGATGGAVTFRPQLADGALVGLRDQESRVFRGEQSNTSILFGDKAILKLFRKLREGINPEVEIGTFLTQHTSFQAFPKLYGTIELEDGDRLTMLGALQQFIPSVGDAWSWLTERVTDAALRASTVDAVATLGKRTGEMHRALASGTDDAFVPEQASGAYATAVRAEAIAELRDTVDQLEQRGVDKVAVLGDALESSLDAFLQLEGTMITRMHGDYHLGQVLRTEGDDFAILDFEGEPTRSLAERRAKASPLRDVAGMLRSFDYAAETARRTESGERADIDKWYTDSRNAFLGAYTETISNDEVLMRGWNAHAREDVLAAFEVHKALYETRYELNNRPDWLEIPLNALRRIAGMESPR